MVGIIDIVQPTKLTQRTVVGSTRINSSVSKSTSISLSRSFISASSPKTLIFRSKISYPKLWSGLKSLV